VDVTPGDSTIEVADRLLTAVAAGRWSTAIEVPSPVPDEVLSAMLVNSLGESLLGFVAWADAEGLLQFSDGQREIAATHHRQSMEHVLRVERVLLTAVDEFERVGIDYRVLKGAALSHVVYSPSSMRSFADADVLVGSSDVDRAVECLQRVGGRRRMPEVRAGFDGQFSKDITVMMNGCAVDLHRSLAAGPYGLKLIAEELFDNPLSFDVGGRQLLTLSARGLYLHAATTVGIADDPPRRVAMRDLVELERGQLSVDPFEVREWSRRLGVDAVLARAVRATTSTLLPDNELALAGWADGFQTRRRDSLYLRAYRGRGRSYRRSLAMLAALPTMRQRSAMLAGLVWPSADYLAARHWSRSAHLRRATTMLRPGGPRRREPLQDEP
jgi:hypothetical protein